MFKFLRSKCYKEGCEFIYEHGEEVYTIRSCSRCGHSFPMSLLTSLIWRGKYSSPKSTKILKKAKRKSLGSGRKKALNAEQIIELKNMIGKGETIVSISKYFNLSRATIYKYRRDMKIADLKGE